jgi:hypothetical protein
MRSSYERDKNVTEQEDLPSTYSRLRPSPHHRTEVG